MLEFALGIAIYYLFQLTHLEMRLLKSKRKDEFCIISGVLAICIMGWLWIIIPESEGAERFVIWGIPAALLFIAVYIWGCEKKISTLVLHLGNISYYIYLIHPYCVRLSEKILGQSIGGEMGYVLMALVGLSSSVLCGHISFYICSMGRKKIK